MRHQKRSVGIFAGFHLCRAWFGAPLLTLLLASACAMPGALPAADAVMKLKVVNQSGFPDDQVYFIMVCQAPLGYFDFRQHVLVATPVFTLDVNTMAASLAQIRQYSGDGTATISCPAMGSTRIYFALGKNFDQMGGFPASGPEKGWGNLVPWAMFEFDLSNHGFVNQSNVDFFSLAYTLAATRSSGEHVTVGITTPSSTIFSAFEAIPLPADSGQQSGNAQIFKSLIVKDAAGAVVRVIAPKAAALGDVGTPAALPQMFTHFLRDYINNHCWKPNRTFSFSSKIAGDSNTYYGRVSADGQTLSIYTDAAMTVPYAPVPTLPRPSNAWGHPAFNANPGLWHNVGAAGTAPDAIDWGYLLYGQDGYVSGPGAHWHLDPVAMAIPVSITRGVMHYDNGTTAWKDSTKYYKGLNGVSAPDRPIFYYGEILHRFGLAGHVYALSFDDVYGHDSGISFTDPNVTLTLHPFSAPPALGPCIRANGRRGTVGVAYPDKVALTVSMQAGQYAGVPVDWWVLAIPSYGSEWYCLHSNLQWAGFPAGDLARCHPVYSGALGNIETPLTVLPSTALPRGTYHVYFAVDYPMDGVLHYPAGSMLSDMVTVVVQ